MDFKNMVADYIFNEEMKVKIVKELNDNVNIPILSEKTEEKIFSAIYDSVEEVIKKAILNNMTQEKLLNLSKKNFTSSKQYTWRNNVINTLEFFYENKN